MTNKEKQELALLIKEAIEDDCDINTIVKRLMRYGFKEGTIRKYYRTWK